MTSTSLRGGACDHCLVSVAVLVVATLAAGFSARPYAGGWNDGSRLATAECLVDQHTLAIDDSIFVRVPPGEGPAVPAGTPDDRPYS